LSTASLVSSVVPSTVTSVVIVSILPPYVFAGMAVSLALTRSPKGGDRNQRGDGDAVSNQPGSR